MDESSDGLNLYLREIGQVPLLTGAAEIELAQASEAGAEAAALLTGGTDHPTDEAARLAFTVQRGAEARHLMIEANLRLVVSQARRFTNRGLPLGDLIQEGNIGLMRAVEKFDYRRGFRFSTYAIWWIRQAMRRALADKSRTIRLPANVEDLMGRYGRVSSELREKLGREPTHDEVASALDVTPQRLLAIVDIARRPMSLEAPAGDEGNATLADLVPDEVSETADDIVERIALHEFAKEALGRLTRRERDVIALRLGLLDDQTRSRLEVGAELGLTVARVREIEVTALRKLRRSCQAA